MNSKPVFALDEVESDLKSAIAHYEGWRLDGKAHVLALYDETIRWFAQSGLHRGLPRLGMHRRGGTGRREEDGESVLRAWAVGATGAY